MTEYTKQINEEFRVLTAFGMIFVICGHYSINAFTFGDLYPYETFHMPLFMFISGYFFKEKNVKNANTVLHYIVKKTKHLLIPYFAWNLFYGGVFIVLTKVGFSNVESTPLNLHTLFVLPFLQAPGFCYNSAAWFVMALFVVEVFNCVMRFACERAGITHDWIWLLGYFVIATASIVYSQYNYDIVCDLGIARNAYLLLWFGVGTFYKSTLERIDNEIPFLYAAIINILLVSLLICGVGDAVSNVWSSTFKGPAFYIMARAALGIWFWLRVIRAFLPVLRKSKTLMFVGKHSFSFMMHQCLAGIAINMIMLHLFPEFIDEATFKADRWYAGTFGTAKIIYLIL